MRQKGFLVGSEEYEKQGIFNRATNVRIRAAIEGKRADGAVLKGHYIGGRSLSSGFDENACFFRLDYLDPDRIEVGRQLQLIMPALWLAAGGIGSVGPVDAAAPWVMPEGSTFAVLLDEGRFRDFRTAVAARADVTHVWFVTNSEEHYAEMRGRLPGRRKTGMLVRDYLRNFCIDDGAGGRA